ncbi:hypothetical protein QR685DRAFT_503648 [Neurospora intermedia]|uniref:Uncharacterized protein n=1 Tax=Neurospora intermedia TaxID=5142 RepID=A0ABR3D468_NEUIN
MSGRDNYVVTVRYLDVKAGDEVIYVDKFGPPESHPSERLSRIQTCKEHFGGLITDIGE